MVRKITFNENILANTETFENIIVIKFNSFVLSDAFAGLQHCHNVIAKKLVSHVNERVRGMNICRNYSTENTNALHTLHFEIDKWHYSIIDPTSAEEEKLNNLNALSRFSAYSHRKTVESCVVKRNMGH